MTVPNPRFQPNLPNRCHRASCQAFEPLQSTTHTRAPAARAAPEAPPNATVDRGRPVSSGERRFHVKHSMPETVQPTTPRSHRHPSEATSPGVV
jgi:hypothetical protein